MSRVSLIAIMLFLLSTAEAQEFKVDTLYSGLKNPTSLLIANDAIYIVEQGNHRILKLDLSGNLIEKFGNRGSGNYQFDSPTDIASSTGLKIFISDPGNNRIQVFDKRWQYLSSIKGNDKFRTRDEISPEYIGVNKLGEIFFYDSRSKSIGKYNEDGAFMDQIPLPGEVKEVSGLQVIDGSIFVLDKKSELVHKISENGFYESFYKAEKGTSFYYLNEALFVSEENTLYQYDRQKVDKILEFETELNIKDLLVIDKQVYILTESSLLKIRLK